MSLPDSSTWSYDSSPREIETRAEFDRFVATGSLAGVTIQGVRLDLDPPDLRAVDVSDALFVGCRFPDVASAADVVGRGGNVVPVFEETPYPSSPSLLYTADELATGFDAETAAPTLDLLIYQHFLSHGGPLPDVREALAQRIHDAGIDDALTDALRDWTAGHGAASIVGVMGGHTERRGSATYRRAARLGAELTRAGNLVATGGGPGVMEAANLGAYFGARDPEELGAAIDLLSRAPDFHDYVPYTSAALDVRSRYPGAPGLAGGGLSIPTWMYGHEPANLFAGSIAKYFSNAIREDTLLRVARGGVVFAPGWAGTVQEIFQAATRAFYRIDGGGGPLVFLDVAFWTDVVPVRSLLAPLLTATPFGDASGLVRLTDDVSEAVAVFAGG